jgi:hypothetical protein
MMRGFTRPVFMHFSWRTTMFCPTELERYHEFEVSLEGVMFFAHLSTSFVLIDRNLALVRASGKHKQGSGSPVDHWSNGRAHQE